MEPDGKGKHIKVSKLEWHDARGNVPEPLPEVEKPKAKASWGNWGQASQQSASWSGHEWPDAKVAAETAHTWSGKKRKHSDTFILPQAYISDLLVDFEEAEVRKLHLASELGEEDVPVSVKMLPSKDGETRCCIARYSDEESLQRAISNVSGMTLTTRSGRVKFVALSVAKPPAWMIEKGLVDRGRDDAAKRAAFSLRTGSAQEHSTRADPTVGIPPAVILPQAYILGIPAEFQDDDVYNLHLASGLEQEDSPVSMRIFPSKDGETTSCVARYKDEESLQRAIGTFSGISVTLKNGVEQRVTASKAKPMGWTKERGAAGEQQDETGSDAVGPQAHISQIPAEYGEEEVISLHKYNIENVTDENLPIDIKMLPSMEVDTCCCIARYRDDKSLQLAISSLSGVTVTTEDGIDKFLVVRAARKPAWMAQQGLFDHPGEVVKTTPVRRFHDGEKWVNEGPAIQPQAYITDLPVEFGEPGVHSLHFDNGVASEDCPVSIKMLPSKDQTGETGCCIARYKDADTLQRAILAISGAIVTTQSGIQKVIGAKEAAPAMWMMKNR